MGRAKVALGVLTASTLAAVGLVLYAGQPDDVERLLRAHASPRVRYTEDEPGSPFLQASIILPPQPIKTVDLCSQLIQRGWHRELFRDSDDSFVQLSPPDPGSSASVDFEAQDGKLTVTYFRPAGRREQMIHSAKVFLHIDDWARSGE